jgi:DNA topoisomerase-1
LEKGRTIIMRKKREKTTAETTVEEFFPVEPRDLKYAIEKPQKQQPELSSLITIEKEGKIIEKKKPKVKVSKKKSAKTTTKKPAKPAKFSKKSKIVSYQPEKVILKKDGYELIITEKPQAALKIASALGKSVKRDNHGIPYYEVDRNGKKIVVACAVGHLFTLTQVSPGAIVPTFDIKWVPNYLAREHDFTKKYYDTLAKLAKGASSLTVATDYDIEGEVIGLNVVRFIGNQNDASRMKFSTLTDKELDESYEEKFPTLNWGQAIAGETRHYLDWFYGINLSRALMNAIKSTGKFKIMSIGRVQGPALNLIVQKEKQISSFKPTPYWQIFITLENPKIELVHNKDIFKKSELEKFENLKGKIAKVETTKKIQEIPPNPPFNLTTLQTESYRLFGINPSKTLQLAQSLYLAGLISYPRTSSQKLPPSINYREILEKLAATYNAKGLLKRKIPVEGKKTDPAHPSIYPTGNFGTTSDDEKKVYDLIVKRFISLFCEDAVLENKTITAEIEVKEKNADEKSVNKVKSTSGSTIKNISLGAGEQFHETKLNNSQRENLRIGNRLIFIKKGSSVENLGWMKIYPVKIPDEHIPDVNGKIKIIDSNIVEKETQPPKRFSPASLVSELEKRNLGTKATRASILETLYDRGYIQGQSITATPLGISLIETLEKHSPIIIDEALTRNFEKEMDQIIQLKRGQVEKEDKIIEEAKQTITKIAEQFKSQEKQIGEELSDATTKFREQQKEENKLNICPICQKGNLKITYSPKTKRSFIGCDKYPECKNTYSLPPNSFIKKTDKICDKCGFPMLMSLRKGKKPWFFCFNRDCETNRERIEEYRKKKEAENKDNSINDA